MTGLFPTETRKMPHKAADNDTGGARRTKSGQVWALGAHRMLVGDAGGPHVAALLATTGPIDMIHTDPPYGVKARNGARDDRQGRFNNRLKIENDDLSDVDLRDLFMRVMGTAAAALKEGGVFYVWYAIMKTGLFWPAMIELGLPPRQVITWAKDHFVLGRMDYHWQTEPCLYGWKGRGHDYYGGRAQSTLWSVKGGGSLRGGRHPSEKPVELPERAIKNSLGGKPGTVYDPFLGTGSTLMAADKLGATCIGCEIDTLYADLIVHRWELRAQRKAEVIGDYSP